MWTWLKWMQILFWVITRLKLDTNHKFCKSLVLKKEFSSGSVSKKDGKWHNEIFLDFKDIVGYINKKLKNSRQEELENQLTRLENRLNSIGWCVLIHRKCHLMHLHSFFIHLLISCHSLKWSKSVIVAEPSFYHSSRDSRPTWVVSMTIG